MAESPLTLFEPDVLRPSQFFATLPRQAPHKTGEYRLLLAVLANAVECFQKYVRAKNKAERQLFEEAEQWIMAENDRRDRLVELTGRAFSFRYVCEVLDIPPDSLRRGVAALA